jgi:uncharacterized membrane protein YphA (DoxX/SURF4 family)
MKSAFAFRSDRRKEAWKSLVLIGRILFGAYWVMAGASHFKDLEMMSGYAKAKGTPAPRLAVAATGFRQ